MKQFLIKMMAATTRLNRSMVWIIGSFVLFLSLLLTVDVLLRYLFNKPTTWAFDLATWGTGIIGFMLGGYALAIGQHVRVDVFFEKMSPKMQSLIDMISAFFLFLMSFSLIWLGFDYVAHYQAIGATSTGGLAIPLWTKWLIVPIGGILIALQGIVKFINDLSVIFTGQILYDTGGEE